MKSVEKKNKKLLCLAILLSFVLVVGIFGVVFAVKKWDNRDEAVADGSTAIQSTSELADKPDVEPVSTETLAANTTEEKKTTEEKSTEAPTESSTSTSRDTEEPDYEASGNTSNNSGNTSGNNTGNTSGNNTGNGGNTTEATTEATTEVTTEATTEATTESDEPSYGDLVWVVDREARWVEVPVYETRYRDVCNGCGMDISYDLDHILGAEAIDRGCGGYHLESYTVQIGTELVYEEEQGHWERYGY